MYVNIDYIVHDNDYTIDAGDYHTCSYDAFYSVVKQIDHCICLHD